MSLLVPPAWKPLFRCPPDSLEHGLYKLLRAKGIVGVAEFFVVAPADVRLWISERAVPPHLGPKLRSENDRIAEAARRQGNGSWAVYRAAYAGGDGAISAIAAARGVTRQAVHKAITYAPKVEPGGPPDEAKYGVTAASVATFAIAGVTLASDTVVEPVVVVESEAGQSETKRRGKRGGR